MKAKRFVKEDGQKVWSKETENGTVVSVCIEVVEETLDLATLFTREEKNMVWLKGNSEELVERQATAVMNQIQAGKLKAYRQFSETPFYEGQEQDINPTTEQPLGRYSQVRLCLPEDYNRLHRQFVTTEIVVAETPAVAESTTSTEQA